MPRGAFDSYSFQRALKDKLLEIVAGLGGFQVLDAAAEEALLGEFFGEDDLRGDENGGLAGLVRHGDFDERLGVIPLAALETQAALGHVLALDDVIGAPGKANADGVVDFDARMLAAIDAQRGGFFASGRKRCEGSSLRFALGITAKLHGRIPGKVGARGEKVG